MPVFVRLVELVYVIELLVYGSIWINRMDKEFSDYKKMGIHLNQFIGSSSSIGAKRLRNVCVAFRAASEQHNRTGSVFFSFLTLSKLAFIYAAHYFLSVTLTTILTYHMRNRIEYIFLLTRCLILWKIPIWICLYVYVRFRCLRALEMLEHDYCYLKNKLHELFQVM